MIEPIHAALERGEKLNIYCELADDFADLDLGALLQLRHVRYRNPPHGW